MKQMKDSDVKKEDNLLYDLSQSASPDEERFQKNLYARLENEYIRPLSDRNLTMPVQHKSRFRYINAAAILAMIILIAAYWLQSSSQPIASIAALIGSVDTLPASSQDNALFAGDVVQSHAASQASILLSDRSLIRLDVQSSLQLIKQREIHLLKGRLFADVAHTSNQEPFTIKTDRLSITVLGTSFEVDAQKEQTTVSVYEGFVRVDWAGRSQTLTQGDALSITMKDGNAHNRQVKTDVPQWFAKLRSVESQSPIIQAMQKYFPSRSWDIHKNQP